jgi:predicted AAA+ superfamily ATPase
MIRRRIQDSIRRAMSDAPVVLLNGARQTGKTTLAPTDEANRCNLRHVAPKTLQKALYRGSPDRKTPLNHRTVLGFRLAQKG